MCYTITGLHSAVAILFWIDFIRSADLITVRVQKRKITKPRLSHTLSLVSILCAGNVGRVAETRSSNTQIFVSNSKTAPSHRPVKWCPSVYSHLTDPTHPPPWSKRGGPTLSVLFNQCIVFSKKKTCAGPSVSALLSSCKRKKKKKAIVCVSVFVRACVYFFYFFNYFFGSHMVWIKRKTQTRL